MAKNTTVWAVKPSNHLLQENIQKDPRFAGEEAELKGVSCSDGRKHHLLAVTFELLSAMVIGAQRRSKRERGFSIWKQDVPGGVFRSVPYEQVLRWVTGRGPEPKISRGVSSAPGPVDKVLQQLLPLSRTARR